jgi:hypothetical protein
MNPELIKTYDAEAAIGANLFCKPGAADGGVLKAAANSDALFGVSSNIAVDSGERCDVIHCGIAFILLGGSVTRGDFLTSDSNGKGIALSVSGNFGAKALVSGVSGDIIPALLTFGSLTVSAGVQEVAVVAAVDGAITAKRGVVIITKATAAALTIAAPTATTDDGKVVRIIAGTAAAHTVTQASDGFNGAGSSGDVATFGGAAGDSMEIVAYQGKWYTTTLRNVTLG